MPSILGHERYRSEASAPTSAAGVNPSSSKAAVRIRSSSIAFSGAEVETVLLNASDRVNRAPQLCDYEAYVDAAALVRAVAGRRLGRA